MPSKKRKQSSLAAVVANKKRKVEKKQLNPFEVRVNRKKHDVLGQRLKSDKGLPGVSRSKAIQKRKKTLLQEYKRRNRTNEFVDRRFGEYDEEMSAENKLMRRLVLEKKRKRESSRFNLEGDEEELTHFGQSIGDMERFDNVQVSEDEIEVEDIGETHFGGFLKKKHPIGDGEESEGDEKPKTRKQIMEEIVAKSKAMKFERQSEKHEVEDLLDRVDTDWKDVQSFLSNAKEGGDMRKGDDYDKVVRELAFERRGRPTDRLKSEEELAKEEKERLEKLELDRIRRMKGLSFTPSKDEHTSADYIYEHSAKKKEVRFALRYEDGKLVQPEGVTEDDKELQPERRSKMEEEDSDEPSDLSDDGEGGDSGEGGDIGEDGEGSDGEMEDETDASDEDLDDPEEDPAGVYGSDLESGNEEGEEEEEDSLQSPEQQSEQLSTKKRSLKGPSQEEVMELKDAASRELPYTFEVPKTLQEFRTIVDHRSPDECVTAVERIHACNHPSISLANKPKLECFFGVLVEFCMKLAVKPNRRSLTILNNLARPLFKLSQLNSVHTAEVFQGVLSRVHEMWLENKAFEYPPFSDLVVFKLIGLIFPTSDYKHPVVTPAMLLMGQLLLKCKVRNMEHLLCGLFVCETMIEFLSQSRRFVPEVVNFLTSTVACFSKRKQCIFYPPFSPKGALHKELCHEGGGESFCCDESEEEFKDVVPLLLVLISKSGQTKEVSDWTKCATLRCAVEQVLRLIVLYRDLSSFLEVFSPVTTNLQSLHHKEWPLDIQDLFSKVDEAFASKKAAPRNLLQLLKQKPKSIKFYEPKFDEVYEVNRKKSRSRSTGEEQKLKYKVKKETKGAVREIRKDAAFLAKEELKETLERDAERERKTKKIMSDLQAMQHEAKIEKRKRR